MTILEARLIILTDLRKSGKHTFTMEEDFSRLFPRVLDEESDKASIILALNSLVKNSIMGRIAIENKTVWVLVQPLESFVKTLSLSFDTAMAMSMIYKDFCEKTGRKKLALDPTNISENDIQILVEMIDFLLPDEPPKPKNISGKE